MGNALNNSGVRSGDVAQASLPASSGSVSLPGSTPVGTTALPEQFTLPNVAEIIGKFGGADQLRNAVNQLQSLLYAA
jgi:hypothetical protein